MTEVFLKQKFKEIKIRSNLAPAILFLNFFFIITDIFGMTSGKVTSGQKALQPQMAMKAQEES